MSETLYIQINRNIQVDKREITIGDVAALLCKNAGITARVKTIKLITLPESDFIVDYIRQKKKSRVWQGLMVAFVSVFTFVGSAYAIMAYNNDVSTNEIFEKVYEMMGTGNFQEYKVIEIAYAVGLLLGIVVFYNHFAGKHFTGDPTPIQVAMRKYEQDVDTTYIETSSRKGKSKKV